MKDKSQAGGFGPKEMILAFIVIVVSATILYPILRRNTNEDTILGESGKMRRVYVGLSLYEDQHDANPAPSLVAAWDYDPIYADYLSKFDPYASTKPGPYPADPGISGAETSRFRISFSYIQNFVRTGKLKTKPWAETRLNPAVGELGDEWTDSVEPQGSFKAMVSGRVIRVNTDGSVFVLPDRGGPKPLGNPHDLFLRLTKSID